MLHCSPSEEAFAAKSNLRAAPLKDRPWQVGLIKGPSGSGKSSIARRLFGARRVKCANRWPGKGAIVDEIIPASPSRSPEYGGESRTHAISGRTSHGLCGRSGPSGVSSRMSQGISPLACKTSSEIFRAWATGLQRASYQRRKSAGRIPVKGCSFWPTPTFKSGGNRACIVGTPQGLQFKADLNQTGKQFGIKNAASAWTLMWDLMGAAGWTPQRFRSSHRFRVILLSGEKHSGDPLSLNPAFTDWMMGWPSGWTDPLQLSNGVVPMAAARAFLDLQQELVV